MKPCETCLPEGLKKVPPFPPVAAKLLSLLQKPDVDTTEISDLIGSDPALTVRVLQCANSAANALSSPITEVLQAVTLLGFDRTRQVTVLSAASGYAARAPRNLELQKCWEHSLAAAILAEEVARTLRLTVAKTAFTAGILHDIGRLGLMVVYPKEYARAIQNSLKIGLDLLEFERDEFGVDHAEAGRILAETWNLPEEFQVVAGRHHDPCEGAEIGLLRVGHLACRLANALGFGLIAPRYQVDIQTIWDTLPPSARKCMEATSDDLRAKVEDRMRKIA